MALSESSVRHIVGFYPFSRFITLQQEFVNRGGDAERIAGLCFKMIRTAPGGFNDTLKALLVLWTPPSAGGAPDAIDFFDADAVSPASAAARPDILTLSVIGTLDIVQNYQGTREFDYVFIDLVTFLYFSNANSNSFYQLHSPNNYIHPVQPTSLSSTPAFINLATERGLLLTRAVFTLRTSAGYEKFRTLRLCPAPEPSLSPTEANRPAISYMIGAACPPVWRDLGNEVLNISESTEARERITHMDKQVVDPKQGSEKCDCVSNNISMLALHQKLVEQGLIDKDPAPVFRIKLWPWILAALIALIFAVLGIITVVKGGHLKNG